MAPGGQRVLHTSQPRTSAWVWPREKGIVYSYARTTIPSSDIVQRAKCPMAISDVAVVSQQEVSEPPMACKTAPLACTDNISTAGGLSEVLYQSLAGTTHGDKAQVALVTCGRRSPPVLP